jgi:hypothetical protein
MIIMIINLNVVIYRSLSLEMSNSKKNHWSNKFDWVDINSIIWL